MGTELTDAERFFYEHAGYRIASGETEHAARVRMARELAAAEQRFVDGSYAFDVLIDNEPWDGDEPYDGPLWDVVLCRECDTCGNHYEIIGSLGGVACELDGPYMRVVKAELAAEYIPA